MEKYLALAREANSSGDRISAENYYQHAEHYYRLIHSNHDNSERARPNVGKPQRRDERRGNGAATETDVIG